MNNIFRYATKELTQDAVISCLLDAKNEISNDFLNDILLKSITKNTPKVEIKNIESVYTQGKEKNSDTLQSSKDVPTKADIFVVFLDNEENKHAVIIEDKVNTFLHSNQMQKYIDIVKKSKNEFKYIHFVLFKTGPYYFWERDFYRKEVIEYSKNNNQCKIMFYEYLINDFTKFINDKITDIEFSWIGDYKTYIEEQTLNVSNNTYWATKYKGTINDFANSIIDSKILEDVEYSYDISLPLFGSGKRQYEFKVYGLCGLKAAKKQIGGSEKEQYYLLPVITLYDNNTTECFLNLNKYSVVNDKNIEGYSSKEKCPYLREVALQIANEKGYSSPRNNGSLKICSSKTTDIIEKNGEYDFSDISEEFNKILELAVELKHKFDNE